METFLNYNEDIPISSNDISESDDCNYNSHIENNGQSGIIILYNNNYTTNSSTMSYDSNSINNATNLNLLAPNTDKII